MKRFFESSFPGAALLGWFFAIFVTWNGAIYADTGAEVRQPWRYLLLHDSYLVDDCPVCGRPSIREPLRGAFELRLIEINPLFSRYAVENLNFTAGSNRTYTIKGSGNFQIGGEVALVQQMELELEINDGLATRVCHLKNPSPAVTGRWPMITLTLEQADGTFTQNYTLHLAAAPLREIWFSTALGFTAGLGEPGPVSGGDFLSSAGRVVHRSSWFCGVLSPMPPCPDPGLDATDLLSGGETAFSITQDMFSERLGPLGHGDVLGSRGRILYRQGDLLAAFAPATPAADAGLDRDDADAVRDEKLKVLRALRPFTPDDVRNKIVRGQYRAGAIEGRAVPGYLDEPGIPEGTTTETFVSMRVDVDNWRWARVPFYLRTGKRMQERMSEIVINFRAVPHAILPGNDAGAVNRLVIRLQPDEGIELHVLAKVPGADMRVKPVKLDLDFAETFKTRQWDAYERLLMDVISGNLTLFMRRDELDAAWQWIDPIHAAWATQSDPPKPYSAGTWGPTASSALIVRDGLCWKEES